MDKAIISFDGTFKTNEMGYQLFVVAVNDLGHQAHTVAYAVMSHRSEETYKAVLDKLIDIIRAVVADDDYDTSVWEVTMSDAEDAVALALEAALPEAKCGMCWFHVKQCIEKKCKSEYMAGVIQLIHALHWTDDEDKC